MPSLSIPSSPVISVTPSSPESSPSRPHPSSSLPHHRPRASVSSSSSAPPAPRSSYIIHIPPSNPSYVAVGGSGKSSAFGGVARPGSGGLGGGGGGGGGGKGAWRQLLESDGPHAGGSDTSAWRRGVVGRKTALAVLVLVMLVFWWKERCAEKGGWEGGGASNGVGVEASAT
ncbi:hypothetical protein JCM10207_007948 [Rhodosporidiobolus poonsookiae]